MTRIKRLLVTGGAGFVGQQLLPELQKHWPQASLHATARQVADGLDEQGVCWHSLDLRQPQAVTNCLAQIQPDTVIHLAAQANVGQSFAQEQTTWDINLQGSLNLYAALKATTPQARLLHISSADVYGASFKSGTPLDETSLLQPLNPYAASKAAADLAAGVLAATSSLHVIRARPFNHTGPGQAESFVLPAFAAQIARIEAGQQTTLQVGNLDAMRDFMHVQDLVQAYIALLNHAEQITSGEVFNICSGQAVSIQSLLDQLLSQARQPIQPVQDPQRLRPSDIHQVSGSYAKLARLTGWSPQTTQAQLLQDLLQSWRHKITPNL